MVCAESVSRDEHSNQLSILSLVEEVRAEGFPIVIPRLAVLVMLERESTDPTIANGFLGVTLAGKQLAKAPIKVDFHGAVLNRVILRSDLVSIPDAGELTFTFSMDDREVASASVTVKQVPREELSVADAKTPAKARA